ncbi:MAG: DUF58 domain-containing protein [Bradymonadia bacterium]
METFPDAETLVLCERFSLWLRQGGGLPVVGRPLRGGMSPGLDFEGHREWVDGLDPRHIDWTLWARHRSVYVRTFEDEGAGTLAVLVDASASMGAGVPARFALVRRLAAALVYAGLREAHGVLLGIAKNGGLERHWLTGGVEAARSAFERLGAARPEGPTALAASFDCLRAWPMRGDAVVLSDFLDPAGAGAGVERLAQMGWRVDLVRVLLPEERSVPATGVGVRDPETGRVAVAPSAEAGLQARLDAHHEGLVAVARGRSALLVDATNDEPFPVVLERLFRGITGTRGGHAGA